MLGSISFYNLSEGPQTRTDYPHAPPTIRQNPCCQGVPAHYQPPCIQPRAQLEPAKPDERKDL